MTILDLLLRPLRAHRVTEAYPQDDKLPGRGVRGTPVLNAEHCDGAAICVAVCPTGAIARDAGPSGTEWRLDYGSCIFCGECVRACPSGAITAVDDFDLAQVRRAAVVAVTSQGEATGA